MVAMTGKPSSLSARMQSPMTSVRKLSSALTWRREPLGRASAIRFSRARKRIRRAVYAEVGRDDLEIDIGSDLAHAAGGIAVSLDETVERCRVGRAFAEQIEARS
jgi:hypothetical protein